MPDLYVQTVFDTLPIPFTGPTVNNYVFHYYVDGTLDPKDKQSTFIRLEEMAKKYYLETKTVPDIGYVFPHKDGRGLAVARLCRIRTIVLEGDAWLNWTLPKLPTRMSMVMGY